MLHCCFLSRFLIQFWYLRMRQENIQKTHETMRYKFIPSNFASMHIITKTKIPYWQFFFYLKKRTTFYMGVSLRKRANYPQQKKEEKSITLKLVTNKEVANPTISKVLIMMCYASSLSKNRHRRRMGCLMKLWWTCLHSEVEALYSLSFETSRYAIDSGFIDGRPLIERELKLMCG